MKAIFDEASANDTYREDQQVRRWEGRILAGVHNVLHQLYPNCDVEIKAKPTYSPEIESMVW